MKYPGYIVGGADEKRTMPRYRRLYEILRKHILDGIYNEGDLLPSENELCRIYGMTRPTVRQSLSALANEGLIIKHQGKGSIVRLQPREIGILSVSGTTSALGNRNLKTKIVTKPVLIRWPENFMFSLSELEIESGCIYMERLRLLDDSPVFYDISYIPNIHLPRITSRQFENRSLFGILREHYHLEMTGGEQRIKAIQATSKTGKYLNLEEGQPVLHLERKIATSNPALFLYSSIY
ncbi:MAG TPA: GntR family transcriptional regulator, partial [Bacteroidales bacterium]|nr:GntR family transcriptional regulator [Bacteroidales bacterium]